MSASSCEICNKSEFEEIEVAKHYTDGQPLHVCVHCGFVQVIYRRPPDEIFLDWIGQKPGDSVYLSADAAVAARHAYVANFMGYELKSIIDIGGGTGAFASRAEDETDNEVQSYDGMAENIEYMSFDVATVLWTLENCGSANEVIKAAHRATGPEGELVVATGSRILVPFKKPLGYYLGTAPLDLHPWRFSANTLVGLIQSHGYKVVKTNRYIDSDYLVVVAKKTSQPRTLAKDDYRKVIDFFNRWHEESKHY